MKKRIISVVLAILMCLSLYIPVSAAEAPAMSASYSQGVVTVTGTGFTGNSSHMIRIVNTSQASVAAMKQVLSDANGSISASVTTGTLSSSNNYSVYVNTADGTNVASVATVSFPTNNGGGNNGGGGGTTGSAVTKFKDISPTSWYYEAVKYVVEAGLMKGTSSTTFEPNTSMSRAMFVTVLYRLAGEPSVSANSKFTDVVSNSWYEDAVIWGTTNGVVKGIGGNKFDPNTSVSREQMAAFMYRYASYKGLDTTIDSNSAVSSFNDSMRVSDWAFEAAEWSVEKGLIVGMGNNKLEPQGTATRVQVATILMRYAEELK